MSSGQDQSGAVIVLHKTYLISRPGELTNKYMSMVQATPQVVVVAAVQYFFTQSAKHAPGEPAVMILCV